MTGGAKKTKEFSLCDIVCDEMSEVFGTQIKGGVLILNYGSITLAKFDQKFNLCTNVF